MVFYGHDACEQQELKEFKVDATIPSKYRGTAADQRDMVVLGKKQVLRVRQPPTRPTTIVLMFSSVTSSLGQCSASQARSWRRGKSCYRECSIGRG